MKLNKSVEVAAFLAVVAQCKENVWVVSPAGDRYNMKSSLSKYVALGALIDNHGDELELYCDSKEDEVLFYEFFDKFPDAL